MAFVRITGLNGKVYVPKRASESGKKHPCEDCFACQMCSDDRCHACRNPKACFSNRELNR